MARKKKNIRMGFIEFANPFKVSPLEALTKKPGRNKPVKVRGKPVKRSTVEGILIGTASGLTTGLMMPELIPVGVAGGVGALAVTKYFKKRKKKR